MKLDIENDKIFSLFVKGENVTGIKKEAEKKKLKKKIKKEYIETLKEILKELNK